MTKEMEFFLFLIERYANKNKKNTGDVFREWDEKGVTMKIFDGYFQYHQESLENAYDDIDNLVSTGEYSSYV